MFTNVLEKRKRQKSLTRAKSPPQLLESLPQSMYQLNQQNITQYQPNPPLYTIQTQQNLPNISQYPPAQQSLQTIPLQTVPYQQPVPQYLSTMTMTTQQIQPNISQYSPVQQPLQTLPLQTVPFLPTDIIDDIEDPLIKPIGMLSEELIPIPDLTKTNNPLLDSMANQSENIAQNGLQTILSSTSNILNFCKDLSSKLELLCTEVTVIKKDLNSLQQNQQQLQYTIDKTQKQMLFLLHCPAFPLKAGEPAVAVWDYDTHILRDFNEKFEELMEYTHEVLLNNFTFPQLCPDFFLPFAHDFLHEMRQQLHLGKDPKVAQMMYLLTARGKELFVHVSSQPQFGKELPVNFVTLIRKVAYPAVY